MLLIYILFVGSGNSQQGCLLGEMFQVFFFACVLKHAGQFSVPAFAGLIGKNFVFRKGKSFAVHGIQQILATARGDGLFSKIFLCHNVPSEAVSSGTDFRERAHRHA